MSVFNIDKEITLFFLYKMIILTDHQPVIAIQRKNISQFLAENDHIDWPLAVITIQKTYFSVFTNIFRFSQYFLVFPVFDRKWSYWLTASSDCNPEEVFPNQLFPWDYGGFLVQVLQG